MAGRHVIIFIGFRYLYFSVGTFLQAVIARKVRLSAEKCLILRKSIDYCGRTVFEEGINFNKSYYNRILNIEKPTYRHELADAYYVAGWLGPSIPKLAQLREPLADEINLAGRTIKQLKLANEHIQWNPDLEKAWHRFKTVISVSAEEGLRNYNPADELVVLMDASYGYWSLIVLQTTSADLDPDITKMQHLRPILFASGKFSASQTRWHIAQKELFPLVTLFNKFNFLATGHPKPLRV